MIHLIKILEDIIRVRRALAFNILIFFINSRTYCICVNIAISLFLITSMPKKKFSGSSFFIENFSEISSITLVIVDEDDPLMTISST